ncbi:hypothetical protein [Nitrospira lenta]|uniref:Uncharacterized protein n=1 Tax=Nitrospira lenta TaxID=1436998 RepID=A0A330L6G2_9BACT|nr:hypothetical protein [Nitrospira lenta]SPP65459.1 hypothetical protein NITLEN_30373 [Nitrospira lenta]
MHAQQTEPLGHDGGCACSSHGSSWGLWGALLVGTIVAAVIGTWLVWFSFVIQRQHNEADIRAACQRVMPETVDRCVDTVVIQRGGMRR